MKLFFDIEPEDMNRAGEASSQIKKKLKLLGINQSIIRNISIATYEAEINVVIHSKGGQIEVLIKDDKIEVFIEDIGPGIEDVDLAMQKGFSTASKSAREMGFGAGMGLPNMHKCCDEFYLNSKKEQFTKIKMVFKLF
ncbi:ATP-binding protein [Helicovermis profundi]